MVEFKFSQARWGPENVTFEWLSALEDTSLERSTGPMCLWFAEDLRVTSDSHGLFTGSSLRLICPDAYGRASS